MNLSIRPQRNAIGPWVGSGGGGSPATLAALQIPSFREEFLSYKPFWDGLPLITSGRWSIDLVNNWLLCNSGTTVDEVRTQMEGDFDVQVKMVHPGTGTTKIHFNNDGDTVIVTIAFDGTNITQTTTGKANTVVANANTTMWLRLARSGVKTITSYWKIADADPWTQLANYTDIDLGPEAEFNLVGNTNSKLLKFICYDNQMSKAIGATLQKRPVALTDGANIATDCTRGDIFTVTLGGNRTMTNPTSSEWSAKIIYRIKQDATGSRLLSWGTDFRFPGGVAPTLSTGANKTDYLGFLRHDTDGKWDLIAEAYNF